MRNPALAASLTCLAAAPSWGFSVATIATKGCHERITLDAARAGGLRARPETVTAADRALLSSLPFNVEGEWDRGTLALLISVRDNDFHGVQAADFARLTEIHFSPRLQHEHCLRGATNDGTAGDEEALRLCRDYILDELRLAATATPGTTIEVTVALTDEVRKLELPTFEVHLGRALHALEDSFAHSLREDGFTKVRSVFNYVDPHGNTYQLERDGHGHVGEFDSCEEGLALQRADAATLAATKIIASLMREGASREERVAEAQLTLDHVLRYEPVCGNGSAWCAEASELLAEYLPPPAAGCSTSSAAPLWALGLLGVLALRRRSMGVLGAVLVATAPLTARAADEVPTVSEEATAHEPPTRLKLLPVFGLGASIDRGGGVVSLGLRLPTLGRVEFFADLELNPWFDLLAGKVNWGAMNADVGLSVRWLTLGPVELRTGAGIGASVLLHDTVSAQAGSVGPFAKMSILNVLFPGPGKTNFELRPEAVLSIPSLRGIPLLYHQYRLVLAMRFDA